ncbi:MAG TPA: DNA-binding response regulator [Microbacterium sp.]|jgi:DNA-binding NarL/FixJ family response regulator|nr:DNA-binding response regulator [Microbacterium sp.]HBS09847.1 DNA-binding response regulator [Microbacterium sp.]|tara:strand:+ start:4254 stop:4859 length:606 start_codon:yes stop_codon:yes gene_type:complete
MRAGFRLILDSAPDLEVVGEAASGEEAVRAASDLRPDVICMDVQMPGMGGLAASRQIVADPGLQCAVVIVTTFDRDDYLFEALQAGASGFLLKNAAPEELQAAVRVAAAGDALLAPEVTRRVIARFAAAAPTPTPTAAADLTERESEVLRLMAQTMSNAEIAAHLIIGEATVKTHVSNVLLKLGVRDRVAAVVYAYRHGLS